AGHGHRDLLLDVLDADLVGCLHVGPGRRRPFQQRLAKFRGCGRLAERREYRAWLVLGPSESRTARCQESGRSRSAGPGRLHGCDGWVRRPVHRNTTRRGRVHLLPSRLQVTVSRDSIRTVLVVTLAVVLLAGAARLQALRERWYQPPESDEVSLYLTSGSMLRRVTVAYQALAADVYWIRAIQYFGGARRANAREVHWPAPPPLMVRDTGGYELLYPLLDLTTSLDPRFNIAYRFGAIFLAEPAPGGPGRPDLAIELLKKGLVERPDKWEYMQDIGFVHYWWLHDYRSAADWFDRAGRIPNAPWWLRSLAATTLARGGDRRSSRAMWESVRESAEIDWLRQEAERSLLRLRALDEIDALQRDIAGYVARAGHTPSDWSELVRASVIPGRPLDPTRTPYGLDFAGRVHLSPSSSLYPLPEEPGTR